MRTIFDGFDNLSENEIRGQIALLRCITLSNTFKEVVQLVRVRKMIDISYNELTELGRPELEKILNQELMKKLQACGSIPVSLEEITPEVLHVLITREAAKVYGIEDYKTPNQKADEIRDKYYEHYLKVLHRKLAKMTEAENVRMDLQIQKAVMQTDIQAVRQLASEMMLREFNGKNIRIRMMSDKSTRTLKRVVDVMGLGIFDGIENVISTVNDSVLMICKIERAILAEIVWTAMNGYGKKISLSDDLMPSYSNGLKKEENEKEKLLLILISKEAELNKTLRSLLNEIDKSNKQIVIKEDALSRDRARLETLQAEYRATLDNKEIILSGGERIKKSFEDYIKNNPMKNNSDIEYRKRKQDYENLARNVRNVEQRIMTYEKSIFRLSESIENQRKQIVDMEQTIKALREELVESVNEFNQVITQLEDEAGYRAQVLQRRWNAFYHTLRFDESIYEKMVKSFTQREIVSVERMLKEMDDCTVKHIFANMTLTLPAQQGKQDTEPDGDVQIPQKAKAVFCLTSTGKCAKIIYDDCEIIDIQVKGR